MLFINVCIHIQYSDEYFIKVRIISFGLIGVFESRSVNKCYVLSCRIKSKDILLNELIEIHLTIITPRA